MKGNVLCKVVIYFIACIFMYLIYVVIFNNRKDYDINLINVEIDKKGLNNISCQKYINTRKYQEDCISPPRLLCRVLVTGLGGSGTHKISQLLLQNGFNLPHERIGLHGSVSWFYAVNDVITKADYPHHSKLKIKSYSSPRFQYVFHLLRSPLSQISSFTSHLNASYDFIRLHMLEQIKIKHTDVNTKINSYNQKNNQINNQLNSEINKQTNNSIMPENSIWINRNYTSFFSIRKNAILHSGKNCQRGNKCWLHFAALSWLFWNSHIQRYSDASYKIESDSEMLIKDVKRLIENNNIDNDKDNDINNNINNNINKENKKNKERNDTNSIADFKNIKNNYDDIQINNRKLIETLYDKKTYLIHNEKKPKKLIKLPKSSIYHKIHHEYTLNDIAIIDVELSKEIQFLSSFFGYDI